MYHKITVEELFQLFGERMPIDIGVLLEKWKGDHKELREILHERAETWQAHLKLEESYDMLSQEYHELLQERIEEN